MPIRIGRIRIGMALDADPTPDPQHWLTQSANGYKSIRFQQFQNVLCRSEIWGLQGLKILYFAKNVIFLFFVTLIFFF